MIKKNLKNFHFIKKNSIFDWEDNNTLFEDLMVIGLNNEGLTYTPNPIWVVNDGNTTTMSVDVNGNINTLGQIRSLGSVIFNMETRRLNYWNPRT